MKGFLNIAFVGAGNLAWHLAPALENLGHRVALVYNRNPKNRQKLIERLYNAIPHKSLDFSATKVDMVFLCVSDSGIHDIVSEIIVPDNCILIHTAGSLSLEVLSQAAPDHAGVFYPLYSFTRSAKVNFREIPIYIEGSDDNAQKTLISLGKGLTKFVYTLNSTQRQALHVAAVFSSNFTNHLLTIAQFLMDQQSIPLKHLYPLVMGNINKAFAIGPYNAQTGPAHRNDHITMHSHMETLSSNPDLQEIYSLLSKHISEKHEGKKKY